MEAVSRLALNDPRPIVCGVDLDHEDGPRTIEVAAELARRLASTLVVVYTAVHPAIAALTTPVAGPAPVAPVATPQPDPAGFSELRADISGRVAQLARQGGAADAEVHVEFDPVAADGLRRAAADRGAELIVIGSRGHGALHAAVLGSTVLDLAREAPCPIVVVAPHG